MRSLFSPVPNMLMGVAGRIRLRMFRRFYDGRRLTWEHVAAYTLWVAMFTLLILEAGV